MNTLVPEAGSVESWEQAIYALLSPMHLLFLGPGGQELHDLAHLTGRNLTVAAKYSDPVLLAHGSVQKAVDRFAGSSVGVILENAADGSRPN